MPCSSITTVASGTVSSTDLRCASRARRIAGGLPIVDAGAVKLLAEPGDADADCGEDRCFHDLGHGQIADATDERCRRED